MQDFKMTVVDAYPAKELDDGRKGFTFRTHNTGTFVNDLVKRKASGKKFWFLGVVDFVVDQQGKIESVDGKFQCSSGVIKRLTWRYLDGLMIADSH